jgi:hypothetical protein
LGYLGDGNSGRWMVVEPTAEPGVNQLEILNAQVLTAPLYDPRTDLSVMALTAAAVDIAVQSRPFRLDPLVRDTATGAYTRPLQCDTIAVKASAPVDGTASVSLIWLDEDYAEVGTPGSVWSAAPPTTFTRQTTWTSHTPPTAAVFVAIKLKWVPGGAALSSGNTVYFREPYITFTGGHFESLASDNFARRYIGP